MLFLRCLFMVILMWWKIKRWWLFRLRPCPKIGDVLSFYPFDSKDTLRQDIIVLGIKDYAISYKIVGNENIHELHAFDFFNLYISKKFLESWDIKL